MATKSAQQEPEKAEVVEEMLDTVDITLDRVKVLYEQYFLGIQKQPPSYLHTDVERKLRDLAQMQIRNTALRYRLVTLQQKFGSYNSYWRRTLRQIENGTYTRSLSKIGRQAARTGAAVPEEILAAMPKRMREQVQRDREAALALARLREHPPVEAEPELLTLADQDVDIDLDDLSPVYIHESAQMHRAAVTADGAHRLAESDAEFDVDAFFAQVASDDRPPTLESLRQGGRARPPSNPAPVVGRAPTARTEPPPTPGRPAPEAVKPMAPSQATRSIPVTPGAAASSAPLAVETLSGPFPRIPGIPSLPDHLRTTPAIPTDRPGAAAPAAPADRARGASPAASKPSRAEPPTHGVRIASPARTPERAPSVAPAASPERAASVPRSSPPPARPAAERSPSPGPPPGERTAAPRPGPPPGMTDADVNALYAQFVKAKQLLGEEAGPGAYGKLLKTINAQAPKIMEQYNAKAVEFSVAVKNNQVIIRAKPRT